MVYAGGEDGISLKDVTVMGTVLNSGKTGAGEGAPMVVERAGVVKAGARGVEFEQSVAVNPETAGLTSVRLHKALPISAFYDAAKGTWITDNTRPIPTPQDPNPLSPVESILRPYLEFKVNGTWYDSWDAAVAKGVKPSALVRSVGSAATQALPQLPSGSAPASSASKFKLDLSRYLKTSDRLRVVWLKPG